jgi:hypothetical protein
MADASESNAHDDAVWQALCQRFSKRPALPGSVRGTLTGEVLTLRPRFDFNLAKRFLPPCAFGMLLLFIATQIAIGARKGQPEYVPMLGGIGGVLLIIGILRIPLQTVCADLATRRAVVTYGLFPFMRKREFSLKGRKSREIPGVSAMGEKLTRLAIYDPADPDKHMLLGLNPTRQDMDLLDGEKREQKKKQDEWSAYSG